MKAILLCAGFGTRMYPLTQDRAKPLLPVAGKPIVGHLVDQLDACKCFDDIIVVANERFHHQFVEWGDDRVTILNDGATDNDNRLGAVQDLAWTVRKHGIDEPVFVSAGDNLFRNVIGPFVTDYRQRPRNLVACYREPDPEKLKRTGVAEISGDGRLVRLVEKPTSPATEWACPALYVLQTGRSRRACCARARRRARQLHRMARATGSGVRPRDAREPSRRGQFGRVR